MTHNENARVFVATVAVLGFGCSSDNPPRSSDAKDATPPVFSKDSDNSVRKIRVPGKSFSGNYRVFSRFPAEIRIVEWKGYSGVCPTTGWVNNGSECEMRFGMVPWTPESTIVVWKVGDSKELHSQTIDLRDVVPPDNDGYTEYTVDEEGVWTVKFASKN